jgi:hypothetical protein
VSEVEGDILAKLEMYLEGEDSFSEPFSKPYHDVEIGTYKMQKDYWGTLRSGCSGVSSRRCSLNVNYKLFLTYQGDGKFMSGTFQIIYQRGTFQVIPK